MEVGSNFSSHTIKEIAFLPNSASNLVVITVEESSINT